MQKKQRKKLKVDHILMQWQRNRQYKVRNEINVKRQQTGFWFQTQQYVILLYLDDVLVFD
jgi:hypothetical protein